MPKYGIISEYPYETDITWFKTLREAITEWMKYSNPEIHHVVAVVPLTVTANDLVHGESASVPQGGNEENDG